MGLNGTQPVVLKAPKNTFETTAEGKTFLHETAHTTCVDFEQLGPDFWKS